MVAKGRNSKNVRLTFNHNVAGPVFVAGTFNGWSTQATPMKRSRDGRWEVLLKLPPGEHQFRYFANGKWFTDYAADGVIPNGLGDFNSIVRVPQETGSKVAKAAAAD
jgi:1,4-alpha-glucan branching enzyme